MTYEQYNEAIDKLIESIKNYKDWDIRFDSVMPVPRGGYYPAIRVAQALGLRIVNEPNSVHTIIIDDLADSGATLLKLRKKYGSANTVFGVVYYNTEHSKIVPNFYGGTKPLGWINFPDEHDNGIEDHIRRIFQHIGEDPDRIGLKGTPDRIVKMWKEIFRGYDPSRKPKITTFPNGEDGLVYDNMVIDEGNYYSECEHHMMPFFGHYWFAYIPNPKGRILGISKVGRVVDYCAAKLQVQERLNREIVDMLTEALGTENPPLGMALVMRGTHLCKSMRGVKKEGIMTSSYLTGAFKNDAQLRNEFMSIVNKDERR